MDSQTYNLHPSETRPRHIPTRCSSPMSLSRKLLGTAAINCTTRTKTGRHVHTHGDATGIVHTSSEERLTLVLSNFGWVHGKLEVITHHLTSHVKRTARREETSSKDPHFEAEKGVRAVLLSVRASLNGDGCSRAVPGKAVRTVVMTLPQLVLGHVTSERLAADIKLADRRN